MSMKNTTKAMLGFLEILGKQVKLGIEDTGLCAFVIWKEAAK